MSQWYLLFFGLSCGTLVLGDCPCQVPEGYHNLHCDDGTINVWPDDFLVVMELCQEELPDLDTVEAIDMVGQTIQSFGPNAFSMFPNLLEISMSFNLIENIDIDAFKGLHQLQNMFLDYNQISRLEPGVFDPLVSLERLDMTENKISKYTTKSWTFSNRISQSYLKVEGLDQFYQDFENNAVISHDYCEDWLVGHSPNFDACEDYGDVLDCSSISTNSDIHELGCYVGATDTYSNVILNFPADPVEIEDFVAPNLGFLNNFNGDNDKIRNLQTTLTFYETHFDLATLTSKTNASVTKQVVIKADTVKLSSSININYNLIIKARVVSLEHEISMNMTAFQFANGDSRTKYEKNVVFGEEFIIRSRKYGLVEIIDVQPSEHEVPSFPPVPVIANDTSLSLDDWFDTTQVNLMYVFASSKQKEWNNLAVNMANFNLQYHKERSVVNNLRTYVAAQKFKQVQMRGRRVRARNVPNYKLSVIKEQAEILHDMMDLYWTQERDQDAQILQSQGRMEDIQRQFEVIQIQQNMYFEKERAALNQIFEFSSNNWEWEFEHRNEIHDNINNAIETTGEFTSEMQEQELNQMLLAAQQSVEHYKDLKVEYQNAVNRWAFDAEESTRVINELNEDLKDSTDTLTEEVDKFEGAVQDYINSQKVSGFLGFIKFIGRLFTQGLNALLDPGGLVDEIKETIEMLQGLADMMSKIGKILAPVKNGETDWLAENCTTNFTEAIHNAADMELKGPLFDKLEITSNIKLKDVDEDTDGKIKGITDLQTAYVTTSKIGNRLLDKVVSYADVVMQLVHSKDQLATAEADIQRAEEEVQNIKDAITQLEDTTNQYHDDMGQNQADYEAKVEELKANWKNATIELKRKLQAEIEERFDRYSQIYSDKQQEYINAIQAGINSITKKLYGLKQASMNQRSMIMVLYEDFCDALFYHTFTECSVDQTPVMADDFSVLLQKLNSLEWDLVQGQNNLDPNPMEFQRILLIEDVDNFTRPISYLKNTSNLALNLKDYVDNPGASYRWRIDRLEVRLLDDQGNLILSNSPYDKDRIRIQITNPNVFNNTNGNREQCTFVGKYTKCLFSYITDTDGSYVVTDSCEVPEEFSGTQFQPSIDGLYNLEIMNDADTLDISRIGQLRIEAYGTNQDYKKQENMIEIH